MGILVNLWLSIPCAVNTITCRLNWIVNRESGKTRSRGCSHSQNCTNLAWSHGNRFCITWMWTDKKPLLCKMLHTYVGAIPVATAYMYRGLHTLHLEGSFQATLASFRIHSYEVSSIPRNFVHILKLVSKWNSTSWISLVLRCGLTLPLQKPCTLWMPKYSWCKF
jgi:hypothetical protein